MTQEQEVICILLSEKDQRFIEISNEITVNRMNPTYGPKIADKEFFKLVSKIEPGTFYCEIKDWEIRDYEFILNNESIMYDLENTITPKPDYIDRMKSNYREIKINKLIDDTKNR